ncbi:hypothetical protein FQR65_LT17117 [Abscondita terminalis]|nr:hypothetical protein FQR65_LT17117 [Abscondita terminalis]
MAGAPTAGDKFYVLESESEARQVANKRLQLQREQGMRDRTYYVSGDWRRLGNRKLQRAECICEKDCGAGARLISPLLYLYVLSKKLLNLRWKVMLAPNWKKKIVANVGDQRDFQNFEVAVLLPECWVLDGKINRNSDIRIVRDGVVVFTGKLASLKRFKDDVKEVSQGYECGLNIQGYNDIHVGDIVEAFEQVEVKRRFYFWKDENNAKYLESYFDKYPGVWCHGDWIKITRNNNGIIMYGRSDATLNRGGVRIGTAEVYNVLNTFEQVEDSLVICIDLENGDSVMPLYIKMSPGTELTDELGPENPKNNYENTYSPRQYPMTILAVPDIHIQ